MINENEYGDVKQPIRPVSMYETREGIKCDMIRSIQVRNYLIQPLLRYNVIKLERNTILCNSSQFCYVYILLNHNY